MLLLLAIEGNDTTDWLNCNNKLKPAAVVQHLSPPSGAKCTLPATHLNLFLNIESNINQENKVQKKDATKMQVIFSKSWDGRLSKFKSLSLWDIAYISAEVVLTERDTQFAQHGDSSFGPRFKQGQLKSNEHKSVLRRTSWRQIPVAMTHRTAPMDSELMELRLFESQITLYTCTLCMCLREGICRHTAELRLKQCSVVQ